MKIAIIGCGNMGRSLAKRLSSFHTVHLYNHHYEKAFHLEKEGLGVAYRELEQAIHGVDFIILAVKPQNLKEVAPLIKKHLKKDQVIVSILAGTTIKTLEEVFHGIAILRMMPNLAVMYGEGVVGLSCNKAIQDKEPLKRAFECLGKIYSLPEEKMDALTALTGSGPAFFLSLVEAMIDAGIAMGFTAKDAKELVYQMLQGSLTLLESTDKHPGELKWQITSPQGTTIAGLHKLEELALRGGLISTFLAAFKEAKKLSSS